jgi:hypothetical protein
MLLPPLNNLPLLPGHRLIQAEPIAQPFPEWNTSSPAHIALSRSRLVLDTSVTGQIYVEDCEVCCHPIEVRYTVQDGAVCDFEARTIE